MVAKAKRHPKKVAQLNTPFARVPHQSVVSAHEAGMAIVYAVYIMLHTFIDGTDDDGNLYAHCSRSFIAEALSLTPDQVRHAIQQLKDKHLIEVVKAGHKGRATQYKLVKGSASVPDPLSQRVRSKTRPYKAIGSAPEPDPEELLKNSFSGTGRTLDAFSPSSDEVKNPAALSAEELAHVFAKAGE